MRIVDKIEPSLFDGIVYGYKRIDMALINLFKLIDKSRENEIVELLNKINNQGITKFNIESLTYERKGRTLSLHELSSGEWIFIVAWLANITKTNIALGVCVQHLGPNIMDTFLQLNHNNSYLTIFTGNKIELYHFLKYKLEELK